MTDAVTVSYKRLPAGTRPSPNIWHHTATYEAENRAADPRGLIEAAMLAVVGAADWSGFRVLDIGCGTGFHLPRFAASASAVVGVEPHPGLATLARRRTRSLSNVEVLTGTAQRLPVADASVDLFLERSPTDVSVELIHRRGDVELHITK